MLRKVNVTPQLDVPGDRALLRVGRQARVLVRRAVDRLSPLHHVADAAELGFASSADPGFQAYLQKGAANLYLMELTTGVTTRITNMQPGQYALFPHFRSDNWIYAQIRDDQRRPRVHGRERRRPAGGINLPE